MGNYVKTRWDGAQDSEWALARIRRLSLLRKCFNWASKARTCAERRMNCARKSSASGGKFKIFELSKGLIFPFLYKNPPVYDWISRLSTFLEVFLHFMISSINGDTEDLLTRRTNKTFLLLLVDFVRIGPPPMEYNFNPIIRYTNVWMRFGRVFFWSPSFSHHLLRFARCNPIKVYQAK